MTEKVLGRRIVNYIRNEALVGRINKQKIQVGNYPMAERQKSLVLSI